MCHQAKDYLSLENRKVKTRSEKAVRGLSVPPIYLFPAVGHTAKKRKSNADIQMQQESVPIPVTQRSSSSSGISGPTGTIRAPTMSSQPIKNLRYFIPLFCGNITIAPSMPGLNEKSVPRFESSTDPEELERFFLRLKELFDKGAIVIDVEKKKYVVSYNDIKMEKQWKVLAYYTTGMFTEFKKDVLGSYDSALTGDHNTMQEIKQLMC